METGFWTILALNIASVFVIAKLSNEGHTGEQAMSDTVTTVFIIAICAVADISLFLAWLAHKIIG